MCTCVDRRYVIARSGKLQNYVPVRAARTACRLFFLNTSIGFQRLGRVTEVMASHAYLSLKRKKPKSECTLTERVPRAAAGKNPNRRGRTPSSTPCLRSEEDLGVADGGVELRHRMQPAACVCLCCGLWQLRSALLPSARAQVAAVSTAYRDTHKWIQLLQLSVDFRMIVT